MSKQDAVALRTDALLRELAPFYDVPVKIAVEVGRLQLRVRDLVKLAADSVVELKRPAGEPFDVSINGLSVARGEVIVVENLAGVRLVEVHKSGAMLP